MTQPSQSAPQNPSETSAQDMAEVSENNSLEGSTDSTATESQAPQAPSEALPMESTAQASEPSPSYVKLAMRNMVKKGSKSLFHFALTTVGLVTLFIGLAYLTR